MNLRGQMLWIALISFATLFASPTDAQDFHNRIRSATNNANQDQVYDLQYKFVQGQELTWDTEHTAKTNNRASGKTGSSSVRTTSVKRWTVKSVEGNGDNLVPAARWIDQHLLGCFDAPCIEEVAKVAVAQLLIDECA